MTAMAARQILVTGFEPFAGDTANPSQELAKAIYLATGSTPAIP